MHICVLLLFISNFAAGCKPDRNDASYKKDNSKWMEKLPDATKLGAISIPGTHDTMAFQSDICTLASPWCKTQEWNLDEQLINGIRFLDIRISQTRSSSKFVIHHDIVYLEASLYDVMNTLNRFLEKNNQETIIMSWQQENREYSDFYERLKELVLEYKDLIYDMTNESGTPTLGDVRGRVVLLNFHKKSSDLGSKAFNGETVVNNWENWQYCECIDTSRFAGGGGGYGGRPSRDQVDSYIESITREIKNNMKTCECHGDKGIPRSYYDEVVNNIKKRKNGNLYHISYLSTTPIGHHQYINEYFERYLTNNNVATPLGAIVMDYPTYRMITLIIDQN